MEGSEAVRYMVRDATVRRVEHCVVQDIDDAH
jgi:hypothetical protein